MNRIIWSIITALLIIIALFAFLNSGNRKDRITNQESSIICLNFGGKRLLIGLREIKSLKEYEFEATLRRSSSGERVNIYKGVQLKDLLKANDIDIEKIDQVVTKAVDGYTVVLSRKEVSEDDNVYIVYEMNQKALLPKKEGGSGPYQLIIRKDSFGQRWNKFLMELDIR